LIDLNQFGSGATDRIGDASVTKVDAVKCWQVLPIAIEHTAETTPVNGLKHVNAVMRPCKDSRELPVQAIARSAERRGKSASTIARAFSGAVSGAVSRAVSGIEWAS
jgi:hypothetical protein